MSGCEYFSLYDPETGALTEWGERLYRGYEGEVSRERQSDIEYGRATYPGVFDREGVEKDALAADREQVDPQKLLKAEATRQSAGIPAACPHDPVAGEDYCVFHISPEDYEAHDLTDRAVCASFVELIDGATETDTRNSKCFAGARLGEIELPYRTLASKSNRPVQLQYAEIGSLNLNDTVVDERLELDGSEIGSLTCENARFRRPVSFERAWIDCERVSFEGTVFEEPMSFCDAEISTTKVEFENCSFESESNFRGVEVGLELGEADPAMIPVVFNQTQFEDGFDCSGGEFYLADDVAQRTQVGIEFLQCRFDGETRFTDREFGRVNGSSSGDAYGGWYGDTETEASNGDDVEWILSLNNSQFGGDVRFDEAEIAGHLKMENTDFGGNTSAFDDMVLDGRVQLNGADFTQSDVDFSDTTIRDEGSEVSGSCLNCREVSFGRGDLTVDGLRVEGDAVFTQASFGQGSLTFDGLDVSGTAKFDQTSFSGREATISGVHVGGSLDLQGSVYSVEGGTLDFSGLTVEGGVNCRQASFAGNTVDWSGMAIDGEVGRDDRFQPPINFRETTWEGGTVDFSDSTMAAETAYDLAVLSGETVLFEGLTVTSDLTFQYVELDATETVFSNLTVRDAETFDMSRASVQGDLIFVDAGGETRLDCETIDFSRLSGEGAMLEFRGVKTGGVEIEFANATVTGGAFEIGDTDTVYNFEGATVGDIDIENSGDGKLFEHFIFRDTDFDGFDFSKSNVKEELKQTGWRIHTSHRGDERDGGRASNRRFGFLRRWARLVRNGPNTDATHPEQLETTYMKAKLGADQQGDPDTVSQFFQKELHFRRHTYGYQFWERSGHGGVEKDRLRLAWDWIANITLGLTVGYGERPSNVVLTSVAVVFVFSFVYRGLDALPSGSSYVDYLTYSLQGFIQLIVGITPTGGVLVRLFTAIEGFIGAFVIALFVITLTRSIDR